MKNTYYKFMCDNCGDEKSAFGFCSNCQIPLTMYSQEAVHPHAVRYIR